MVKVVVVALELAVGTLCNSASLISRIAYNWFYLVAWAPKVDNEYDSSTRKAGKRHSSGCNGLHTRCYSICTKLPLQDCCTYTGFSQVSIRLLLLPRELKPFLRLHWNFPCSCVIRVYWVSLKSALVFCNY